MQPSFCCLPGGRELFPLPTPAKESGYCGDGHGITVLKQTQKLLHGEKVSYGALTQLTLEHRPVDEIHAIIRFCKQVKLPTTLADLNLADVSDAELLKAAKEACKPVDTMVNMPFAVNPTDIVAAMREVDTLSRAG